MIDEKIQAKKTPTKIPPKTSFAISDQTSIYM
jgi:hypothetical protein